MQYLMQYCPNGFNVVLMQYFISIMPLTQKENQTAVNWFDFNEKLCSWWIQNLIKGLN